MVALAACTVLFFAHVAFAASSLVRVGRRARHADDEIAGAVRTTGVIVDVVTRPAFHADATPHVLLKFPRVSFTTADGRESTFTSDYGTSLRPRVGNTVAVVYDPTDPSRAQIPRDAQPRVAGCAHLLSWTFLAAFTVFGIIGLTVAWLVAIFLGHASP